MRWGCVGGYIMGEWGKGGTSRIRQNRKQMLINIEGTDMLPSPGLFSTIAISIPTCCGNDYFCYDKYIKSIIFVIPAVIEPIKITIANIIKSHHEFPINCLIRQTRVKFVIARGGMNVICVPYSFVY